MRGVCFGRGLEPLERRDLFATFTVTSTADSGPGSLRQALIDANATTTADVIRFNISGTPKQIRPHSALPNIMNPVTIDGTSQPGYAGKPLVEINGPLAGTGVSGFNVKATHAVFKGLSITSFNGAGIILGGAGGSVVQSCYIGVDPTGTRNRGNGADAIVIPGTSGNVVGGKLDGQGNVLAFNGTTGHSINGGNTAPAIFVYGAGTKNLFYRNSIYDNRGFGIDLVSGKDSKGRFLKTPDAVPNTGDTLDADTGPNGLQNAAALFFAGPTPGYLSVLGNMSSAPRRTYHIELFYSPNAFQNTGPAQAKTYVTSTDVTTDKAGFAQIFMSVGQTIPGALFSLTTTGPDGTSEISLPTLSRAGTVSGNVYFDANSNGRKDTVEKGVAGATVYFDQNLNGKRDIGEPETTTDANGNYTFTDAQGGPERIRVDGSAVGYRSSSPSVGYYDRTLPTTKNKGLNFGMTNTGLISGMVYNDANKNGKKDTGETTGLSGWTIYIDSNNDGKLDTGDKSVLTDAKGDYTFNNLPAAHYVIRIAPKTGFKIFSTTSISGGLNAGQIVTDINFGAHAVG